ncbi:MAG: SRPBCC domain-containing protein [Ginsengibacter sp.]
MAKTIVQKIVFKNTTTDKLYNFYMNAKQHSLITGAPAKISNKVGAAFSAHGTYITGKNLFLVKNELIVQTWRAESWTKNDPDSVFIIGLEKKGNDVMLNAVHVNVPDNAEASLKKGWFDHYWNPMKDHLAGKEIKKISM